MGKLKRKGAYEYKMAWHQDHSALVVPKVAEKVLVEGAPIRQTLKEWPDVMDFMLRLKVPKSGRLQWGSGEPRTEWGVVYVTDEKGNTENIILEPTDDLVQNTTRYLVTVNGNPLWKWLPPTGKIKATGEPNPNWRRIGVQSGWKATVCNRLTDTDELKRWIDYDYYTQEVEKLVMGLK